MTRLPAVFSPYCSMLIIEADHGNASSDHHKNAAEPPSAARRVAPLLPICCLCRLIRDETGGSLKSERWVTQRKYQKTHGVNPADCIQTHTYCPRCFTQVRETMRTAQVMETFDGSLAKGR